MRKNLYKIEIWLIKTLPFTLAAFEFVKTVLSIFGIIIPILGYISSVSIISWLFLMTSSYVFNFCEWHRIPLYYIATNQVINIIDYYWLYCLSDTAMLVVYSLVFGAFSIISGILKYKGNES